MHDNKARIILDLIESPFITVYIYLLQVITIFSASNYYAIGSNKGAYMRLNNQLVPHFVQYISAASQTKELSFKQRMGIVECAALKELAVRMREHRDELEEEFQKYDPDDSGCITIAKWCFVMESVTKLGLPWRLLREKLAPGTDSQSVNYIRTLDLLDTDVIVSKEMKMKLIIYFIFDPHSRFLPDESRG